MPRPKVGDKRADILAAAIERIAEEGVGASTASIADAARVAEGSLFRYFQDKDHLLNEVYVEIKHDLRRPLSDQFPATAHCENAPTMGEVSAVIGFRLGSAPRRHARPKDGVETVD
jgi:AcrR family transcriptional regulator